MSGLIPLANIILDFRKADGTLNAGGTLEFFENLTLTPKSVFNGYQSATTLANPLQLDAGGFEPGAWLGEGAYRIRLRETAPSFPTVLGPVVWTKDDINPTAAANTVSVTVNTTVDATFSGKIIEAQNAVTLTITSAATLGNGFHCWIKDNSSGDVTLSRANASDIIDLVQDNIKLEADQMIFFAVNGPATGFITDRLKENSLEQVSRMRSLF